MEKDNDNLVNVFSESGNRIQFVQQVLSGKCFQQQLTAVLGTNTAVSLHLVCVKIGDKS